MEPFEVTFPENKKIDIKFKNFLIKTDQSLKNGGEETAPEPFALFLASLASCAGIYAKVFCESRKIDTSEMKLFLEVFFKEKQKLIHRIELSLHVGQDFPEKYVKPVIKAMEGCAVKAQLHPDIEAETKVVYK